MRDQLLEEKIAELNRLEAECHLPFPYTDCRKIHASRLGSRKRYRDLIPDLDIYGSWVSGNCSWSSKILEWTPERMRKTLKISSTSFFAWFPQYEPLKLQITKRRYPRLYSDLKRYAKMRQVLAEVLTYLISHANPAQIEVSVSRRKKRGLSRHPLLNRKMRLAHRQARVAYRHRERVIRPVKFQGPAVRVIRIKPLGENIF